MKTMILAAGFGTRLRPMTNYIPKPLFEFLDTTILEYNISKCIDLGIKEIYINAHYLHEQIQKYVEKCKLKFPGISIYISEEKKILGVGGGIGRLKKQFDNEDVLIINGDVIDNFNLNFFLNFYKNQKNIFAALGLYNYPEINTVRLGKKNNILSFTELSGNKNNLTFTGISIITPDIYNNLPANKFFNIIDLYQKILKKHRTKIVGYKFPNKNFWTDIGTPERYFQLYSDILNDKIKFDLTKKIKNKTIIETGSQLNNNILTGFNYIGKNCKIKNCKLENTIIWDETELLSGNYKNAILSPYFQININ